MILPRTCNYCGAEISDGFYCSDACFFEDADEQVKKKGYFHPYVPLQISTVAPLATAKEEHGSSQKKKTKEQKRWLLNVQALES